MALITMKTDCSIDHPDVSPALSPTSSTVSGLPVQLLQLPWQFLQGPDLPFQPFQPSIQNPLIARLAALAVDRNDADMMRQAIDEGFDAPWLGNCPKRPVPIGYWPIWIGRTKAWVFNILSLLPCKSQG